MNTIVEGISEFDTKCKSINHREIEATIEIFIQKILAAFESTMHRSDFDEYIDSEVVFV